MIILTLTDEVEGIPEVGQKFFTEIIIDGNSEEMGILDKIRFRTGYADVELVQDAMVLQKKKIDDTI